MPWFGALERLLLGGNLPWIFMPLICTGEQCWCPQSGILLGGNTVEAHTWALSQVPTFLMDPCPPSGSSLHMHTVHLGKAADKELHCNKHNAELYVHMFCMFHNCNGFRQIKLSSFPLSISPGCGIPAETRAFWKEVQPLTWHRENQENP